MKIKSVIIILFFIIIGFTAKTQTQYFNNIYNIYNNNIIGTSIVKDDTTFIVVSFALDSTNYSRINFSRFDNKGNLIFKKNYGNGSRNYYPGHSGSLQKISDGNLIVSGVFADSIGATAFILKINNNFDSIFFKEFKDSIYQSIEFQQGKETHDKGFILGGDIETGTHKDALLIIKTDSLGNLVFKKTISLIGIDYVRDLIVTPDKGFLLGCYSWDWYNASYSGDPWVMKLDSLGNFEWDNKYGGPNQDSPAIVTIDKDSNYIVAFGYAYLTIPTVGSSYIIEVLKIDRNGNTIWDKQYDTISIGNPYMIKVLNNGNIIVVGTGSTFYPLSWVLNLNTIGNEKYFRWFYKFDDSHTLDNTAWDFCILDDNSIIVCGDVQQDTMFQCLWLAKLDSFGCMQPGCQNVGIEEIKQEKAEIKVYPNPAKDYFIVEYNIIDKFDHATIEITDMLGHKIQEIVLNSSKGQKIINTTTFTKGIYNCCVKNNGKNIGQSNIIIK